MENIDINTRIIMSMSQGFANTYLLYTACRLEIFDFIESNIDTSVELSKKIDIENVILEKILRPLVAYDFLEEQNTKYKLTEKGMLLTDKSPRSLKGYVLYCGGICAKSWAMMAEAAKDRKTPYSLAIGTELFAENRKDEKQYNTFNNMMNFVSEGVLLADFLNDIEDIKGKGLLTLEEEREQS